jgi:hypothetical protein
MEVCKFEGQADMYGLGIRLGIYFLWYGILFALWLAPHKISEFRSSVDAFVASTFLAITILLAQDVKKLEPVETYILSLLMLGTYFSLAPIYVWKILTLCNPYWDPTAVPRVPPDNTEELISFSLLMGLLVFQYWFWFDQVPTLNRRNCAQYGFLFSKARLNGKATVSFYALLFVFLGVVWLYILLMRIQYLLGRSSVHEENIRKSKYRSRRGERVRLLQSLDFWVRLAVAMTVTIAIELTIQWNDI